MRHPLRLLGLLILPIAAVFASSESGGDDSERNARLVEKYRRDDPVYYERLRRDLRAFYRLPAERRDRLRQLDRALLEQDSTTQRRLWEVLDRFNAWLDRLSEEDRRRVEEAPTREERLRVIKELREQEFIRHLPKKVRETLDTLPADMRAAEIARLREEERQVRLAWNPEGRHRPGVVPRSKPTRPIDLSADAQAFVAEVLLPMLTEKERSELKAAEGHWPLFARTLLDLAEKHPVPLPGPSTGPSSPKDLKEAKAAFNTLTAKGSAKKQLHLLEGKWPDYARELTRLARTHNVPIKALGPSRPEEFVPLVRTFITEELTPKLADDQKAELKNAEGLWPDYPEKLLELSRKHNLDIPMMRLPGARDLWDKVRTVAELPEVPDGTLREFFQTELSEKERAELRLSLEDPDWRDRLRQEFFKRNPRALKRLSENDKKTFSGKK